MRTSKLNKFFGERVQKMRMDKEITQEQLAEKVGVTRVQITNIEGGNNGPSCETLFYIVQALNCSYNDLLPTKSQLDNYQPIDNKIARKKKKMLEQIAFLQEQVAQLK